MTDADTFKVAPSASIDTTSPSVARAYDLFLGGKNNYTVDAEFRDQFLQICPPGIELATENRGWLVRASRWMAASAGIDQFLDVGSGLPTQENTHDVVQRVTPEATVLYVDNDPVCQAHGRALLEDNHYTRFVDADLRNAREVLEHPVVQQHIDWTRPVGLIQSGTLHHVADEYQPQEVMRQYRDALPPGSVLALSHFYDPEDGGRLSQLCRDLENAMLNVGTGWWRNQAAIEAFFGDFDMVSPGVVRLCDWWPTGPRVGELTDAQRLIAGGVAVKPR